MSFCPSCGKELSNEESNAKFCAYCGKPLAAEAPVVEEAPKTEEAPKLEAPKTTTGVTKKKIVKRRKIEGTKE